MATYSNQHWLLSHIRNSFISTDDTGICETVMVSDDMPHNFLRKHQQATATAPPKHNGPSTRAGHRSLDRPLTEADFICYPGLDESDDDDDLSAQSFDIQMFPEVGGHRFRSNTAQKLEKMDIARRRAARTKCIHYDDELVPPESSDFFERKVVRPSATLNERGDATQPGGGEVKSQLSLQLANTPKQAQNKFMEFARFDGTSQTGMATKRLNVFLNMLPEKERNYPIKICVIASAKILEVIGLICYTATVQFPEVPLKSIRHYALYMTEDNDDLDDFPPLDNREPCSKFGFSHLTLAERRPLAPVTRIDYHVGNNVGIAPTKSMTSEDENSRLTVSLLDNSDTKTGSPDEEHSNDISENNDILEAPLYRTFQLHIIDKRFFKTEVTLGIAGDRIEIDQHKNAKFWTKQKAVTYPIDSIAFCEIVERRSSKSVVRIWLKSSSSPSSVASGATAGAHSGPGAETKNVTIVTPGGTAHSPASPSHYSSPFAFFMGSVGGSHRDHQHHQQIRFKHYDFEAESQKAEQIQKKMDCILKVRSSEVRREFLLLRERKLEKSQAKKSLKL